MLKVEGVDLGLAPAAAKSANALVTAAPTKLSTPQPSVCLKWPWFCQDTFYLVLNISDPTKLSTPHTSTCLKWKALTSGRPGRR